MGSVAVSRRRAASGFTLMELVMVLAIIVVVGAIAAPMYQGTLRQERVRKAAEVVAADWTRTRARAMESGEAQVWICQIGDNSFTSSSFANSGISSADAASLVTADTGLTPTGPVSTTDRFGQMFPQGITVNEVLVSEADTMVLMGQSSNTNESGTATVFFYPDGTSSSARLTVMGEDQQSMAVVMNGLAGTVRVVQVEESQ